MHRLFLLPLALIGLGSGISSALSQEIVRISVPADGTVFLQPTNVPLSITIMVSVSREANAPTDVYVGDILLGTTRLSQNHLLAWNDVPFGSHTLTAVHHMSSGPVTSSVVRVEVDYGGYAIVPPGSVWHYRDGGVDLGTAWRGTDVDVSTWPLGPAKIGFGDDDAATVLEDWEDPSTGEVYPTYYFRHAFDIPSPSIHTNMAVRLRRDDGAIVYLNGKELFRDNMPEIEVDYQTLALRPVGDEYGFTQYWINPEHVLPGTNYFAVEIHNAHPFNQDVGFDLGLIADIPSPPPSLTIERQSSSIRIAWPTDSQGYQLESADTLGFPETDWSPVSEDLIAVQGQMVYTNNLDGKMKVFRLKLE